MAQSNLSEKTLLLLCNAPDCKTAEQISENLLAARAAACINILPACRSLYRWQGTIERAEETPLLIKTTAAKSAQAQTIIADTHPYDVPEIIAINISGGLPAYLQWILEECDD